MNSKQTFTSNGNGLKSIATKSDVHTELVLGRTVGSIYFVRMNFSPSQKIVNRTPWFVFYEPEVSQFLSKITPEFLEKLLEALSSHSSYYTKDEFLKTFGICSNTCEK